MFIYGDHRYGGSFGGKTHELLDNYPELSNLLFDFSQNENYRI